jgi:hypothetical protein
LKYKENKCIFDSVYAGGLKMLRKAYLLGAISIAFIICMQPMVLAEEKELTEPKYEFERHIYEPFSFYFIQDGEFICDIYIDIYEEPLEGNSEGLEYGYENEWDEPLYYKGSIKTIWLTYNGYGICIVIDGPDMGLNTHIYVEIYLRHVDGSIDIHILTGIIPV